MRSIPMTGNQFVYKACMDYQLGCVCIDYDFFSLFFLFFLWLGEGLRMDHFDSVHGAVS